MRIVLMNGSPRKERGASAVWLQLLGDHLAAPSHRVDTVYLWQERLSGEEKALIAQADVLVLSAPLFADSIPSLSWQRLLQVGDEISHKGVRFFALIGCGYHEGENARTQMQILHNWCQAQGMLWGMGLGIGGNTVVVGTTDAYRDKTATIRGAVAALAAALEAGETGEDTYCSVDMPMRAYRRISEYIGYCMLQEAGGNTDEL